MLLFFYFLDFAIPPIIGVTSAPLPPFGTFISALYLAYRLKSTGTQPCTCFRISITFSITFV